MIIYVCRHCWKIVGLEDISEINQIKGMNCLECYQKGEEGPTMQFPDTKANDNDDTSFWHTPESNTKKKNDNKTLR